jgi:hypothetical protein
MTWSRSAAGQNPQIVCEPKLTSRHKPTTLDKHECIIQVISIGHLAGKDEPFPRNDSYRTSCISDVQLGSQSDRCFFVICLERNIFVGFLHLGVSWMQQYLLY